MNDIVQIFTDGSSKGNPGPSGWAYLMKWRGVEKQDSGYLGTSTNNRAELTAVIKALQAIKRRVGKIEIYSDSEYVVNGINKYLKGWVARNFIRVKNPDLWQQIHDLLHERAAAWEVHHVRGHSGHPENEIVDKLAQRAAGSRK